MIPFFSRSRSPVLSTTSATGPNLTDLLQQQVPVSKSTLEPSQPFGNNLQKPVPFRSIANSSAGTYLHLGTYFHAPIFYISAYFAYTRTYAHLRTHMRHNTYFLHMNLLSLSLACIKHILSSIIHASFAVSRFKIQPHIICPIFSVCRNHISRLFSVSTGWKYATEFLLGYFDVLDNPILFISLFSLSKTLIFHILPLYSFFENTFLTFLSHLFHFLSGYFISFWCPLSPRQLGFYNLVFVFVLFISTQNATIWYLV
jgi:hypothetical protein